MKKNSKEMIKCECCGFSESILSDLFETRILAISSIESTFKSEIVYVCEYCLCGIMEHEIENEKWLKNNQDFPLYDEDELFN